ncbi:DUF4397 domain-containing protein [candidate division KSB1 bacterium]|nr:DUF4397 domain-containing protein [candidate division KSB1 bacterium]
MKIVTWSFALIFSLSLSNNISATNWQKSFGPFKGEINKVYVDQINPAILYATTNKSVYKTVNEGQTWQELLSTETPLYVFSIAPSNQNIIYTDSKKSSNGGISWETIQPVPYSKIEFRLQSADDIDNKIAIHPDNPDIVFAGLSSFGMYRSTDGALTWNIIPGAPQGLVLFNPENSAQLFCAGSDSFYISTNNGNSWLSMGAYPVTGDYVPKKIIYDAGTFYLLMGTGNDELKGKILLRSKNNGIDWTELNFSIAYQEYLTEINSIAGKNGYLFVATNIGLYQSIDEGQTWLHFYSGFDALNHVAFTNRIITGSKNYGVSVTRDLTNAWQNIGLQNIDASDAKLISSKAGDMYVQWQGGLYKRAATPDTWQTFLPPHKETVQNCALSISNIDSSSVLAIYDHVFFKYTTQDQTWKALGFFSDTPAFKIGHSKNDNLLFCLSQSRMLYRSINAGLSWSKLDTPIGEMIHDFHYSDKQNLYVLTNLNYYSSINSGDSFQALRSGLPAESLQSEEIWYKKEDTDHLYLQVAEKIYQKSTATALWNVFYPETSLIFPGVSRRFVTAPDSNQTVFSMTPQYFDGATYLVRYDKNDALWLPIQTNFDSVSFTNFNFAEYAPYELFHINNSGEIWHGDVLSQVDSIDFSHARIQVVHTAADPLLDSLDVYLNTTKLIDNIKFNQATPFFDVPAGAFARFSIAPASSASALDSLINFSTTLELGQTYSVTITGVLDTTKFAINPQGMSRRLKFIFTKDTKETNPIATKVQFCFQNNVPDAPAIDLIVRDLAEIADSIAYNTSSNYILLSPNDYLFDLKPSSDDSIRLASFHVDLRAFSGRVFTLTASGFLDSEANQDGPQLSLMGSFPSGQQIVFDNEENAPGAPSFSILSSPSNAALDVPIRPTLKWRSTLRATTYQLQLDSHPSFDDLMVDLQGIYDTTTVVSGLAENQKYYWRVRALNSTGAGQWSSVWSFTTTSSITTPAAPALILPGNKEKEVATRVQFKWSTVENTQSYTLEYSFNQQFSPALQLRNIIDTTFTVDSLQNALTYYWHVRSQNSSGTSAWSDIYSFTTRLAPAPLMSPTLLQPGDSAQNVFTNTTLRWHAVSGAANYALEISNDQNFSPAIFYETIMDTTKRMHELKNATTYYWRVRSADSTRLSLWSIPFEFTTVPNYPLAYAVDETLSIPTFSQSSVLQSSDYRIIGLPGNAGFLLDSLLAGDQNENWKAFWDNGASTDYYLPFDGSEEFQLQTGRAFWVLHKGPIQLNTSLSTAKLDTNGFVHIPLHPGWNLITNPFMQSVSWQLIVDYNAVTQPIWCYDGSFLLADSLNPFEGYYFFNINSLSEIRIPYDALFEEESVGQDTFNTGKVLLTFVSAEGNNVDDVFISIDDRASSGYDKFDAVKPRSLSKTPILSIDNSNWSYLPQKYAIDVRPENQGVQKWEIELLRPLAAGGVLKVETNHLMKERQFFLKDNHSGNVVPIDKKRQIPVRKSSQTQKWTLLYATENEVQEYLIDSLEDNLQVEALFPNPFMYSTKLRLLSKTTQNINVKIYNILGNRIATLFKGPIKSGNCEIIWDGRNEVGQYVSTGLYFVMIDSNEKRYVRKVIFLK